MQQSNNPFIDTYGVVHCNPNEISENGPLFTLYYYILKYLSGNIIEPDVINNLLIALYNPLEKRWQDRAGEAGYHFSLDNCLGIYGLRELGKLHIPVGGLNKQVSTPHWFLHPRDRIFFGLMDNKWWAYLLLPILIIIMIISLSQPYEVTSGKLLAFGRIHTLIHKSKKFKFLLVIANYFINRTYKQGGWREVFAYYFKEIDHPCNVLSRELF